MNNLFSPEQQQARINLRHCYLQALISITGSSIIDRAEMIDQRGMYAEEIAKMLNRANVINIRTGKPWATGSVWSCYRDWQRLPQQEKQLARFLRQDIAATAR